MPLHLTRSIIDNIHNGSLASSRTAIDPVFGFDVVTECQGVPREMLEPRLAWDDATAYESTAQSLAAQFRENYRQYADDADPAIGAAGPAA